MKRDRDTLQPFLRFDELDDTPIDYRIPGLLTEQGNVLLSAYRKLGKTSLILDLAIALTSPRKFLGRLDCKELDGPLVYLNLELLQPMLVQYLLDLGYKQNDKLLFDDKRGTASLFQLADEGWRDKYIDALLREGARGLIVDPIHPLLVGGGADSNNNDESRYTCELLGEIARYAELDHLFIVDHTGHADKSRARGASGKEDWADMLWNVDSDDALGTYRTLNVVGRGVGGTQRYMRQEKKLLAVDSSNVDTDKPEGGETTMGIILEYMREEARAVTVQAICSATGLSQTTVSYNLKKSVTAVERIPAKEGRAELWKIVGKLPF